MAVIITNIDMPKSCGNCRFITARNGCIANEKAQINSFKEVSDDCPLKSIDGLAEAIEQFPFTYGYASDIERVINKYCDKENKDADSN